MITFRGKATPLPGLDSVWHFCFSDLPSTERCPSFREAASPSPSRPPFSDRNSFRSISVSVCANRNVFGLEGQASTFGLEFRISGVCLGSTIVGIVLYVSGTGLIVSEIGLCVSGIGLNVSEIDRNVSEIGLCSETFVVVVDVVVFRHDEFVAIWKQKKCCFFIKWFIVPSSMYF